MRRMRVALLAAVLLAMVAGMSPALAVPAQNTPPTLPPGFSLPPGVTLPPGFSAPATTSTTSSTSTTVSPIVSASEVTTTTSTTVAAAGTTLPTTPANSTPSATSSDVAEGPPGPSIAAAAATGRGFPRSQNIALVPDTGGQEDHGGSFPTSGFPNGYAPVFTNVSAEAIRDNATDPIGSGYDTVVLNSLCGIAGFLSSGQFKARVEGFASRGGKVLIWDSECTTTDYSNFAIPFKTSNPGAAGAQGTLTDAEDNTLSSSNPASGSYVNLNAVANDTDAVGDANVFTTFDSRWFLDLKATNTLGVNGAAQAYANLGKGIVIYNGLDKDSIGGGGFDPASTSGSVHLSRIWMLDLLQAWNPDGLPHANPVVGGGGFRVSPSEGPVGTAFTFTYSCPAGTFPALLIVDDSGRPLAQGFGYGIPVSGNGRDYVQTITMKIAGTFSGSLLCSGVSSGSSTKFTVKGAATASTFKYVALGDSFSAGEGVEPFFDLTNRCHRSTHAYAVKVEQPGHKGVPIYQRFLGGEAGLEWGFQACSGAVTASLLTEGHHGDPLPQLALDRAGDINNPYSLPVDTNTNLVTLTIGGNDIHFADILKFCYFAAKCATEKFRAYCQQDSATCNNAGFKPDETLASYIDRTLTALSAKLDAVYAQIRLQAPNARVLVLGYPQLFPATANEQRCERLAQPNPFDVNGFTTTEQNFLRRGTSIMNAIIQQRATAAKFEFIRTDGLFAGHEICGNDGQWINPPSYTAGTHGLGAAADKSFHPNSCGQDAFAILVNLRLNAYLRDVAC